MSMDIGSEEKHVENNHNEIILKPTTLNSASGDIKDLMCETETSDNKDGFSTRSQLGFLMSIIGSLFIAVGVSCGQAIQGTVADFELAAMRGVVQLLIALCYFIVTRRLPTLKKETAVWVFLYACMITTFNITTFLSVNYIAVGISGAIVRALAIVVATILARIVVKEVITVVKLLSVLLSIAGVILVVQPWYDRSTIEATSVSNNGNHNAWLLQLHQWVHSYFIKSDSSIFISDNYQSKVSTIHPSEAPEVINALEDEILGYVFAVIAGINISSSAVLLKARLMECNPFTLNLYTGLINTVVPLCVSLATEKIVFPTEWDYILLVLGQSIMTGMAAVLVIAATFMTTAVLVMIAMSMQVVFLLIPQYTVLSSIQPSIGNWVEILGAVVVVLSALLPPLWQIPQKKCAPRESRYQVDQ